MYRGETMKTYLVGGAVRDMLMGLEPKDKDYVVVGSSVEKMLYGTKRSGLIPWAHDGTIVTGKQIGRAHV